MDANDALRNLLARNLGPADRARVLWNPDLRAAMLREVEDLLAALDDPAWPDLGPR